MNEEELICIIGRFCDDIINKTHFNCKKGCPFADTIDKYDECDVWRTITRIRSEN